MERKPLIVDDLLRRAARYRRLVQAGDYLAEHYQHLAELLEEEAASWERLPLQSSIGC